MIRVFQVRMDARATQFVAEVLHSGYIGQGPRVEQFERELRAYLDCEHLLSVNSCTSALDLALHLIGVGPGDEVVTTPITCTATNGVVVRRCAVPIWADVDPVTGLISPDDVARKITPRTKAIMAVDWGGRPCDWRRLKSFGVPVVEDAAHALSTHHGGDYVCYSFQAVKHLTCGDGGAIIVPAEQYARAKLLRWYGLDRESSASFRCSQNIREVGYKYHLNDVSAAIGLANLEGLEQSVERHRCNAAMYAKELKGMHGIVLPPPSDQSSWWLYSLLVTDRSERDRFEAHMRDFGIETSRVHSRNDLHDGFHYPNGPLPGVDAFDDRQISIPVGWWVTDDDRQRIVDAVRAWDSSGTKSSGRKVESAVR
jgi:dTDP-4-amino-4,6-dideoxygalactose transaminase